VGKEENKKGDEERWDWKGRK